MLRAWVASTAFILFSGCVKIKKRRNYLVCCKFSETGSWIINRAGC